MHPTESEMHPIYGTLLNLFVIPKCRSAPSGHCGIFVVRGPNDQIRPAGGRPGSQCAHWLSLLCAEGAKADDPRHVVVADCISFATTFL